MREKRLYVVGHDSDEAIICGENGNEHEDSCLAITAEEAKWEAKYYRPNAKIYKLVPVSPEDI